MASSTTAGLVGTTCATLTLGSQLCCSTGRDQCLCLPIRRFVDQHISITTSPDQETAEIDRVIDNLVKSGKIFGPGSRGGPGPAPPTMGGGRGYNDHSMFILVLDDTTRNL